ncbi:MAG: hypothetical protein QRY74_03350 [Chlamydia sp.]
MNPIELLPKESLLRLTNSWEGFVYHIRIIMDQKAYRYKDMYTLFSWIDPHFQAPKKAFVQRLQGFIIGCGFPSGRKALYFDLFLSFLQQYRVLFQGAPSEVITLFNELIEQLFPGCYTTLLIDPSWAYRKMTQEERLLDEGKKSKEQLLQWLSDVHEDQDRGQSSTITLKDALDAIPFNIDGEIEPFSPKYRLFFPSKEEEKSFLNRVQEVDLIGYQELLDQFKSLNQGLFLDANSEYKAAVEAFSKLPIDIDFFYQKRLLTESIALFSKVVESIKLLFIRKEALEEKASSLLLCLKNRELFHRVKVLDPMSSPLIHQELNILHSLIAKAVQDEVSYYIEIEESKIALLIKNWDLFQSDFLFPDLIAIAEDLRGRIQRKIPQIQKNIYLESSSLQELESLFIDSDLMFIRAQKRERLKRAQGIRKSFAQNILSLDCHLAVANLFQLQESSSFKSAIRLRASMRSFYISLLDLQKIFSKDHDLEAIHSSFYVLWKRADEWKKEVQAALILLDASIAKAAYLSGKEDLCRKLFQKLLDEETKNRSIESILALFFSQAQGSFHQFYRSFRASNSEVIQYAEEFSNLAIAIMSLREGPFLRDLEGIFDVLEMTLGFVESSEPLLFSPLFSNSQLIASYSVLIEALQIVHESLKKNFTEKQSDKPPFFVASELLQIIENRDRIQQNIDKQLHLL